MEKIFQFFINRKILVNLIVVIFLFFGFWAMNNIPREGMPLIELNQLSILTKYPGASPEDVELNVTVKIEEVLKEEDGLTDITSISIENSSFIMVQIDESMGKSKVAEIKSDVQKAVDSIKDLPNEIDKPIITELKTSDVPIIEIALSCTNRAFLRQTVEKLEMKIERLKGVAGVDKIGYFDKEIHIEVDPDKMKQAYMSLPEIVMSIQKRNLRSTSGTLESYKGLKNIVILNKFKSPIDVEDVILRSNFDYKNIKLKQIAKVSVKEKNENLIVRNNGERGISLIVRKKENADIIRTIKHIKKLIKRIIPSKIKYSYINDQSKTTRLRLKLLTSNGIIGFIFVVILLLIFLNRRSALWTAFGIPFCFIAALIFLPIFNLTLSAVSLAGFIIVLGMLVDDAIVVSEKVSSYQELGLEPKQASLKAVKEMAVPVTAAAITTICAYLPMFVMGGRPGKFIWSIPVIVIIALAISLFECFFILPNHLAHGKIKAKPKAGWIIKLENFYNILLKRVLKHYKILISVFVLLLIVLLMIAKFTLKFQMFPQSNIDTFFIKIEGPKEQSLKETEKVIMRIEKTIVQLSKKELASYTSRVGHHSTSKTKNSGDHENWGIITVFLTPDTQRKRTVGQIVKELRKKIKLEKNIKLIIDKKKSGPIQDKPITIHIISNNEELRLMAEQRVLKFLRSMKKMGVSDIDTDRKRGIDELVINMDHEKMAGLGLSVFDVAQSLRIAFDGEIVTSIQTADEEIEYRLILNELSRRKESVINKIGIKNKEGRLIKIKSFISFIEKKADLAIYHRDSERSITITAEVMPKKITAVKAAKYIKKELIDKWKIPDSLEVIIGGEAEKTNIIFGDVKFAVILSLFLIFCVIAVMLDSLSQPLIIMSIIPFSLIGVFIALFIHGQNMSMFVLLAIISLIGIIVNDSIVMVSTLNKSLNSKNKLKNKTDLFKLIAEGAKSRLRPILLTTFTTLGGLFPMAYGLGGYEKMLSPMALALSWGLLFGTLITLFLIPSLYVILFNQKKY